MNTQYSQLLKRIYLATNNLAIVKINYKTSIHGMNMLQKWTTIAILLASLFSTTVRADDYPDCMDLYVDGMYMGGCTLTLDGVEKINQYFINHNENTFFLLLDVHMEKGVSEALVTVLENNNQITDLRVYSTNFAATELQHLAKNDHLLSVELVDNNFDEASFLSLAANKSIERLVLGEHAVSISALNTFLDEHPIKSLGLNSLTLSENDLQELFTKHSSFHSLYLTNLQVKDLNALSLLNNIEYLGIFSMHVSDEDLAQIATLKSLKAIDLSSTDVTPTGTNHLAQLKNLESVYMDIYPTQTNETPGVGDAGVAFIKELPHLKSVYLKNQRLTKEAAMTIGQNKNLTEVQLPGNEIGDEGAIILNSLPNLEELGLTYNNIGDMAAVVIANNNSIVRINLSENHIGDIGGVALANKTNLSRLNIMFNQLTDISANAFAKRTSPLKWLIVYNNLFSEAGIDALYTNKNIEYVGAGDSPQLQHHLLVRKLNKKDHRLYSNNIPWLTVPK